MRTLVSKAILACLSLTLVASCSPDEGNGAPPPADSEAISVALTAVPAGMRCVRFTTVAAGRTFAQDFDVMGLMNLTAQVRGLPANVALSISADAYAVACASITPTTQATWTSAPVAVTLVPGVVQSVPIALRPSGGVNSDVDFLFLASSPISKGFASTVVGQTSAVTTFTVTNIGPAMTGVLAASLTGLNANQFAIGTNGCTMPLPVNGTCAIQVTFKPTATGVKMATLQVAGAPGGTLPIALTGTGVQAAVLALAPATQDFGSVGVGLSSPLVTYTVTNSGGTTTAPVTVTSSDASFVVSDSTCANVLAQSQTCQVKVAFAPTAVGPKVATLTATAGTVTATATVSGAAVAAPALTLTPSALDFGTVAVGDAKNIPVAVKNVGGFTLDTFNILLGGTTGDAAFVVDTRNCVNSGPLVPGATCTLTVAAAPGVDLGGPFVSASSTILFSAGGAHSATVMGTASVTVSWPFTANPLAVLFGQVKIGTSVSRTVRFTNVSARPLGPVAISTSGAPYTLTSDGCSGAALYAPGAFCDVILRYAPTGQVSSLGAIHAQLPNFPEAFQVQGSGIP